MEENEASSEPDRWATQDLDRLRDALINRSLAVIVGTGVTLNATAESSGKPLQRLTWTGLIQNGLEYLVYQKCINPSSDKKIRAEEALKVSDTNSLLEAANILKSLLDEHDKFPSWLGTVFCGLHEEIRHPAILDALKALHERGVPLLTTNYDEILEYHCKISRIRPSDADDGLKFMQGDLDGVFHVHGSYNDPRNVVLDTTDYLRVKSSESVQEVLKFFLTGKTVLFIGCGSGLEDPNFDSLLEWAAERYKHIRNRHSFLVRDDDNRAYRPLVRVSYGKKHEDLSEYLQQLMIGPAQKANSPITQPGTPPKANPEPLYISAISRKDNQIDLFLCGTGGEVYTTSNVSSDVWKNGCEWRSIRGRFQPGMKISVVSKASEKLDLFVCDDHGDVHTTWWQGEFGFEDWSSLREGWQKIGDGFPADAEITVVARNADDLDIFIGGKDGQVHHRQWRMHRHPFNWLRHGAWGLWKSLDGSFPVGVRISAVIRPSEQIDLFACDGNGSVRTSSSRSDSNWSEWETIGVGFPAGAAVTAIFRNGSLHLFVCGKNGQVYTAQWIEDLGWPKPDDWTSLDGSFLPGTMVTAIFRSSKQIDLFICDRNGSVSTSWWTIRDGWSEWKSIDGEYPGRVEVAAVIRNPGSDFEVFVGGYDGQEYIAEMKRGAQSRWDKRWQLIWKEVR